MAAAIVPALLSAVDALRLSQETGGEAPPGHPFFGALFLFVGSLLLVETLAGSVWRRNRLRTMLWPAALLGSGAGMLVVTYVQPDDKALHLTLAILLLLGAFFEGRYRLGQVSRSAADAFAIPALIVGGIVIGPLHTNGSLLYSTSAQTHLLAGIMGFILAAVRLAQMQHGHTLGLDRVFGVGVMLLGVSLLFVQQFHGH